MRFKACVGLFLALAACGYPSFTATLPGEELIPGMSASSDAGALTNFPPVTQLTSFDLDKNTDFQMNDATRSIMVSAKPASVSLQIASPNSQDFSFLDSVSLVATAGDQEVIFASRSDVADLKLTAPTPTMTLDVMDVELAPQLASPAASIVMRGHGSYPSADTRIEVTVKLNVQVNPKAKQ